MRSATLPHDLESLRGLRAARWVRESTAGQVDRYGPAAQRDQQDRALERFGLVDVGLAWEVAHSGRTVGQTPAFAEMVAAAGTDFDVLLVGYVSRFARDLRTAVNARHDLHASGAALLFCDEGLLSSDEEAWERWAREAVEAEAYSRRLARRISEAFAAKFRTGDQAGSPGLGFRRTAPPEARLEIDLTTMPAAVALFERYATGEVSYVELEAESGIRADAIRAILSNPLYNGWAVRHRRSSTVSRNAAPWRSQPPVSDPLWARVTEVRRRRSRGGGPRSGRVHPLSGIAFCASCGTRLRCDVAVPRGYQYRRLRHPRPCPGWAASSRRAERYEAPLIAQLTGLRLDTKILAQIRRLSQLDTPPVPEISLRRRQLETELEDLAHRHARRRLSTPEYVSEHQRIVAELDAAEPPAPPASVDPDANIAALRDLRAAWRDADEAARAKLLRAVYERVIVDDQGVREVLLTPEAYRHGLALAMPEVMSLARPAGIEPAT
jgi:DNA invertase Pin-like site-specific DNA recombinase